jgi:hypothetical protein
MPRTSKKVIVATCDLCCEPIDKDQEMLKCEGDCQSSVHRYCAGVSKRQYDELTKGSTPYVCQWCSSRTTQAVIQQLQSEVAALKSELTEVKARLERSENAAESLRVRKSYASAVTQQSNRSSRRPRQAGSGVKLKWGPPKTGTPGPY